MTTERESLAGDFAQACAAGLIDVKFFAFVGEETTVESLCGAPSKVEQALRDGHVAPFEVDDEVMVLSDIGPLLY